MKENLRAYSSTVYPFHMPGHKLGRLSPLADQDLYKIDVTEVEGTDQLFQPDGIIYNAQKHAAEVYGALETFFLVNGSSCGILSAISACCKPDGKVLISRNSHKSVYHAVLINRLDPIYVYPDAIEEYHLLGGIAPENVKRALIEHPEITCVVITSPTYDGFTSDIEAISQITKRHGSLLIVDEAHGAHFKFCNCFPKSALECGADIVIHSLHKTLPAFTQSALLHVNSTSVNTEKLKRYLEMYQTSSPSYILMTGMDSCISIVQENRVKYFDKLLKSITSFRNKIAEFKNIKLIGEEICGKYNIHNIDISKLVFVGKREDINGKYVDKILRDEYQIQIEMAMRSSFLALTSIADDEAAFNKLYMALFSIDQKLATETQVDIRELRNKVDEVSRQKLYTPFQTDQLQMEEISLKHARDRICGQFINVYPPGIPLLIPGEKITVDQLNQLNDYILRGFSVIGIEQATIKVVK